MITLLEAQHFDNGICIDKESLIPNTLHQQGEEFILKVIFARATGVIIPESFYVGLDSRPAINLTDTLSSLVAEPINNGYVRQAISSNNGFNVSLGSLNWVLTSRNIIFSATGGSWGPVKNIFLTNVPNEDGYLISSIKLKKPKTLSSGQSLSIRIAVGLRNAGGG